MTDRRTRSLIFLSDAAYTILALLALAWWRPMLLVELYWWLAIGCARPR